MDMYIAFLDIAVANFPTDQLSASSNPITTNQILRQFWSNDEMLSFTKHIAGPLRSVITRDFLLLLITGYRQWKRDSGQRQ